MNDEDLTKPDFIIIGAIKAGTTSIYRYLNTHPEIVMSSRKEVNYFLGTNFNDKNLSWYASHFPKDPAGKKCGEASPNYTNHPKYKAVPARIKDVVPNAKLIYLLRDPIDRIISKYKHNYARDDIKNRHERSMEEVLLSNSEEYIAASKYWTQLSHYLDHFSLDDITIIQSEHLWSNTEEVLQQIFEELGVDSEFSHPVFGQGFNTSTRRRDPRLFDAWLRKTSIKDVLRPYLPRSLVRLYKKVAMKPVPKEKIKNKAELTPGLENKLKDLLNEDIRLLRKNTDRDFSGWKI